MCVQEISINLTISMLCSLIPGLNCFLLASQVVLVVKKYSYLENPWTQEPGRLQSMGSLRVGHDWTTSLSVFTFMHWRRKWQPIPVFILAWRIPGAGKSGGLPSMGSHRVGHDWSDLAAAAGELVTFDFSRTDDQGKITSIPSYPLPWF